MAKYRVMEFGVQSYWPTTGKSVAETVEQIMRRNGCGMVEIFIGTTWRKIAAFEPFYGLVTEV